jgi:acyl-CoA thioesterase I
MKTMRRVSSTLAVCASLAFVASVACGRGGRDASQGRQGRAASASSEAATDAAAPVADTSARRVVVLGDSLTAGLGLPPKEAYPTLLQEHISEDGLNYSIVNAGVSGDTSAGGLARLDWALDGDVRVLIVALGGNDGLRGLPATQLAQNLSQIIERAQARGIRVVLAGMEAPPNYGFEYAASFHKVYPALAKRYRVALVPFLLEGVGGIAALNQPDGIHPTAEGARIVADNVWTVLKPLLEAESQQVARGRAVSQ